MNAPHLDPIDCALRYAGLGWPVLPVYEPVAPGVCSCRDAACGRDTGKHPRTPHGKRDASTDHAVIRSWWERWPAASVAIALPIADLLVVDIDPRHGGIESWDALRAEHGEPPPTVYARTGSGGYHGLYRRSPGALRSRLAPGIDLPTSYIIAPPSLHASGERYSWVRAPWDRPIADAPTWLLDLAHGRARGAPSAGPAPGETAPRPRALDGADSTDSGTDWRTALSMIRRGATDTEVAAVLRAGPSYAKRHHERAEHYVTHTITKARAVVESTPAPDPWSASLPVRVVRAVYEAPPITHDGRATAHRVRLECVTRDGELLPRQYVVLPLAGHESARHVYDATLGDIELASWLAPDGWRLAERLVGRVLDVVIAPGARRALWMRAAECANTESGARTLPSERETR